MRVLVIVDGSNVYYRLKELGISADYNQLTRLLVGGNQLIAKAIYVGVVRGGADAESALLMARQQRFLGHLRQSGWEIKEGYLLKSAGRYAEKGVDVQMALDIAVGAVLDQYDKVCLVSSDTDLLPAIEIALRYGKQVEYVGFAHRPSRALAKRCSSKWLLNRAELEALSQP